MFSLKLINPPSLLNASIKSSNRFMISWIMPMISRNNIMINIRCHISFKWMTKFGCIYRRMPCRSPSEGPNPLIWALHHHQGCGRQCFQAQQSPIPWLASNVQCGPPSAILFTIVGHIKYCRTTNTNKTQPRLHGAGHN